MRVIAILDRSAGNETVGDMWKETASFDVKTPIIDILEWARVQSQTAEMGCFHHNLVITIDQSSVGELVEGEG